MRGSRVSAASPPSTRGNFHHILLILLYPTYWERGLWSSINFWPSNDSQYVFHTCFLVKKIKILALQAPTVINLLLSFHIIITIKNCDKTFLKIILRLKKLLKSDDVSTLAERHYQRRKVIINGESQFTVLRKCQSKFDCLVFEMLFIKKLKPNLNIQTDSIRAKLFV